VTDRQTDMNTQMHMDRQDVATNIHFAQRSLYCTMGRHVPPQKLCLLLGGSEPHLIRGFLGLTKAMSQMSPQSVQLFSRLTEVSDRHTDIPYCTCRNRSHL